MKNLLLSFFTLTIIVSCSAQEYPSKETQIAQAVLALPESFRAEATVLGYDGSDELTVIREGSNAMYCLADNPGQDGFSVAGYHKDMDPYMARGRVLKKEGKSFQERFDIREEEVKAGKLEIQHGTTLYVVSGEFDEKGEPANLYQRFVVYIPFETAESSGLPLQPSYPGGPWIMNPGTHNAHIMINPTQVEAKE